MEADRVTPPRRLSPQLLRRSVQTAILRVVHARYWQTTTFRLAVVFSILFAVGVIALLGLIYWQTAGYMTRQVDHILTVEAGALTQLDEPKLRQAIEDGVARDYRRIFFYGLFDSKGVRIAGNVPTLPAGFVPDGALHPFPHPAIEDDEHLRASVRALGVHLAGGETLVVGRDVAQLDEIRDIILRALEWWGSLTLLLGLAVSVALSVRPLRRIGDIHRASHEIVRGNIAARLPIAGTRDELDILAGIVNSMLDEIERLMSEVKSVCDNIAHDLRTPLTRLRAQMYRFQQEIEPDDVHRESVERAVAEIDSLLARFQALLRISEIEEGLRRSAFTDLDLLTIAEQIIDLYEPLAEEKGVRLKSRIPASLNIRGDGELLFEAISNLVDNAIKFSPPGGEVIVAMTAGAAPAIDIIDSGPGIALEEREAVLQRFYRSARDRSVVGHGLGLSIVAAVVRLHGFSLDFGRSDTGGTQATIKCHPHRP